MSWRFGNDITVDGGAYVNLKELILDRSEDAIKLFTDEELEEELKSRQDGRSKYDSRNNKLSDIYVNNLQIDVDVYEALEEMTNTDLLTEVKDRGISIVEYAEVSKRDLRNVICQSLDINEYSYSDEEIFEMLKELWKTRIR
jgi:hypothetical protein